FFFFSSRRRHTRWPRDWSSDVCSSDLTLRAVLDDYFCENEKARAYVLDEQGKVRQHMVVFIDGDLVHDRDGLTDAVEPNSVIDRSEERRVGKECRSRRWVEH